MSKPGVDRIVTPMPRQLVERIDDFRFSRRLASRAEAIRQLIEGGLKNPPSPIKEPKTKV
jgi:metal-responsive CopG/Arc/MetJ family transcriptional regulator